MPLNVTCSHIRRICRTWLLCWAHSSRSLCLYKIYLVHVCVCLWALVSFTLNDVSLLRWALSGWVPQQSAHKEQSLTTDLFAWNAPFNMCDVFVDTLLIFHIRRLPYSRLELLVRVQLKHKVNERFHFYSFNFDEMRLCWKMTCFMLLYRRMPFFSLFHQF